LISWLTGHSLATLSGVIVDGTGRTLNDAPRSTTGVRNISCQTLTFVVAVDVLVRSTNRWNHNELTISSVVVELIASRALLVASNTKGVIDISVEALTLIVAVYKHVRPTNRLTLTDRAVVYIPRGAVDVDTVTSLQHVTMVTLTLVEGIDKHICTANGNANAGCRVILVSSCTVRHTTNCARLETEITLALVAGIDEHVGPTDGLTPRRSMIV